MLRSVHVKRVPWLMLVWHLRSTCLVERLKAGCESEETCKLEKRKGWQCIGMNESTACRQVL